MHKPLFHFFSTFLIVGYRIILLNKFNKDFPQQIVLNVTLSCPSIFLAYMLCYACCYNRPIWLALYRLTDSGKIFFSLNVSSFYRKLVFFMFHFIDNCPGWLERPQPFTCDYYCNCFTLWPPSIVKSIYCEAYLLWSLSIVRFLTVPDSSMGHFVFDWLTDLCWIFF